MTWLVVFVVLALLGSVAVLPGCGATSPTQDPGTATSVHVEQRPTCGGECAAATDNDPATLCNHPLATVVDVSAPSGAPNTSGGFDWGTLLWWGLGLLGVAAAVGAVVMLRRAKGDVVPAGEPLDLAPRSG